MTPQTRQLCILTLWQVYRLQGLENSRLNSTRPSVAGRRDGHARCRRLARGGDADALGRESRLRLRPSSPLAASTVHTVGIGVVYDLAGNQLAAPGNSNFTEPNSALVASTLYFVKVFGTTDLSGQAINFISSSFTTGPQ